MSKEICNAGFAREVDEQNSDTAQEFLKAKCKCPQWIPTQTFGSYDQKGLEISKSASRVSIELIRCKCRNNTSCGMLIVR